MVAVAKGWGAAVNTQEDVHCYNIRGGRVDIYIQHRHLH